MKILVIAPSNHEIMFEDIKKLERCFKAVFSSIHNRKDIPVTGNFVNKGSKNRETIQCLQGYCIKHLLYVDMLHIR